MTSINTRSFNLEAIDYTETFYQVESYSITNENSSLVNKICITHNEKDDFEIVNFFLLIKSNIKTLSCSYNSETCETSKVSTYNTSGILDFALKSRIIISIKSFNKSKENSYLVITTENEVYIQNIDNIENFRCIFTLDKSLGGIKDVFICSKSEEGKKKEYQESMYFMIVINDNIIVEVDPFQDDNNKETNTYMMLAYEYLKTGKYDPKKITSNSYETSFSCLIIPYEVIKPISGKATCLKSIVYFSKSVSPRIIVSRPFVNIGYNHIAIVFDKGLLGIFHYESMTLIGVYNSSFGDITSINYSFDGRLLAIGCEDDNAYIVDAEKNSLLYGLEGHKNYISSVCFSSKIEEEPYTDRYSVENNSQSNKGKNLNVKENKQYSEVSQSEMFLSYKTMSNIESHNLLSKNEQSLSANAVGGLRKSKIISNKNLKEVLEENNNTKNNSKYVNYLLYTASLDGQIASWQIDIVLERNYLNKANYFDPDKVKQTNKIDSIVKIINLDLSVENHLQCASMEKICTSQIYHLQVVNNFLFYLAKSNISVSDIYWRCYHSKVSKQQEIVNNDKDKRSNISQNKSINSRSIQSSGVKLKRRDK